jgi:hypothetical protein
MDKNVRPTEAGRSGVEARGFEFGRTPARDVARRRISLPMPSLTHRIGSATGALPPRSYIVHRHNPATFQRERYSTVSRFVSLAQNTQKPQKPGHPNPWKAPGKKGGMTRARVARA